MPPSVLLQLRCFFVSLSTIFTCLISALNSVSFGCSCQWSERGRQKEYLLTLKDTMINTAVLFQLSIIPIRLMTFGQQPVSPGMSSQYLLSKRARVYTPEAEDGDIEQGLTEGENGDNDLTDTFAYFSFGEFKL